MSFEEFIDSLKFEIPIKRMLDVLMALWWDKKGDWDRAHKVAQEIHDWRGSWVHAYLHRKEGDNQNASYWYSNAGKTMTDLSLNEEWNVIARFFCDK